MSKFLQKFVFSFLSFVVLLNFTLLTPSRAYAQESTWYNQPFTEWYAKVYTTENQSEIFGERYTAAQVQWILYSLFSFPINFLGSEVQGITSCAIAAGSAGLNLDANSDCTTQAVDFIKSVFTFLKITDSGGQDQNKLTFGQTIISDYQNRPISGIKYVNTTLSKFFTVPVANAQGFGFGAVDGLQKFWQGFRNIAYALSVLVIIIFAFMIMFRVKLSPQLVISVQSALPKIVTALILATFSYAIAGFVIDLSYVVGGLFASLMNVAGFGTFKEAWDMIVPVGLTEVLGGFYTLAFMVAYTVAFFITAVFTLVGTVSGLSLFGMIGSVLSILISIWVLLLMLWYAIKVPWILLKTLISLFLSIVVAPVQIVLGAVVPSIGFGTWLKKIIAEALVFPLTGLFMYLAMKTLIQSMLASFGPAGLFLGLTTNPQNLWSPPILGSSADMAGILWLAVSFTFITLIPKAVDIMKMLIMGEKFAFGSAISEAAIPFTAGAAYGSSTMANTGTLPWPINAIYSRVTNKNIPETGSTNVRAIGSTIQTVLRAK